MFIISSARRYSTDMFPTTSSLISSNSALYMRSSLRSRMSKSERAKLTDTCLFADSPIGPYTVHPRGVFTAHGCPFVPSLRSRQLSIMSGRSLPIKMVTCLSPVSGRMMSCRCGHLRTSSLVATCLGVTGRLSVVNMPSS